MFFSHRAWRHAYAAAYWHQARQTASRTARQQACSQQFDSEPKLQHSMFTWSSGPMFGVRRPLRHLAWKLNLDEAQMRALVDVLDRLKTGYAQARLDQDRSTSEVAAVFSTAAFDDERAKSALLTRTRATETLNQELLAALRGIFDLLNEEQRREFAYLLRSGAFVL
jgi:hypothetical protein